MILVPVNIFFSHKEIFRAESESTIFRSTFNYVDAMGTYSKKYDTFYTLC